ncbi:unnamed protein product (macronuclear) [Paramecium tetraurelia]|uniref:Uncharacterized protein n=1 Tax=Paramecium tetraurelia TaxID=5888 RepID=A0CAE8_PARTE|nr:uncharacterized protein GSPATT00036545001 [Paramecium tetraurelia]CAK67765.1 unnamed protein product [Paramecium tetraurelia]|eukprot:XP_001435162.1 hypothetical protein (macronuclear) [Paramecium tetraurelia strain d4-2]
MGDYYLEFLQQYLHNVNLRKKIGERTIERKGCQKQFEVRLKQKEGNNHSFEERKKRLRSLASEIQRNFECPITKCGKKYGYDTIPFVQQKRRFLELAYQTQAS